MIGGSIGTVSYTHLGENFNKSMLRWKMPEIEMTDNKTDYNKSRRSIKHWSLLEIEIQNKRSIITICIKSTRKLKNLRQVTSQK